MCSISEGVSGRELNQEMELSPHKRFTSMSTHSSRRLKVVESKGGGGTVCVIPCCSLNRVMLQNTIQQTLQQHKVDKSTCDWCPGPYVLTVSRTRNRNRPRRQAGTFPASTWPFLSNLLPRVMVTMTETDNRGSINSLLPLVRASKLLLGLVCLPTGTYPRKRKSSTILVNTEGLGGDMAWSDRSDRGIRLQSD